jgi:hypothetical protein
MAHRADGSSACSDPCAAVDFGGGVKIDSVAHAGHLRPRRSGAISRNRRNGLTGSR